MLLTKNAGLNNVNEQLTQKTQKMSRASSSKETVRSAAVEVRSTTAPSLELIERATLRRVGSSTSSAAATAHYSDLTTSLEHESHEPADIPGYIPEVSDGSSTSAGGAGSGSAAPSAIGSEPGVTASSGKKDTAMSKLQKRYKVIEKKDHDYLNAFNGRDYEKYWYRHDDIARIGESLIKDLNKEAEVGVIFAPPQGFDGTYDPSRELGKFRAVLEAGNRLVGTVNTGSNHWIAYALEIDRTQASYSGATSAEGSREATLGAAAGGGRIAGGVGAKSRGAADAALEMASEAAESTRGAEPLGSRSGDGSKILCVYKDSYGRKRGDFEKIVKRAFGVDSGDAVDVRILEEGEKDQKDTTSCGLFALKNMEALAKYTGNLGSAGGATGSEVTEIAFYKVDEEKDKDELLVLRREFGEVYASSVINERVEDILSRKWVDLHRDFESSTVESIKGSLSDDLKAKIDRNEISIGFRGNRDIDEGLELRVELGNLAEDERKAIKTSLKKHLKRGSTDIAIEERLEGGSLAKYVVKVSNLKNSKDTPVSRLGEQRWSESSSLNLSSEEVKESAKILVKELRPIRVDDLGAIETRLASNVKFESVRGKLLQNKDTREKAYIHEAAEGGDAEFLEALLNAGTSPNLGYREGGVDQNMLKLAYQKYIISLEENPQNKNYGECLSLLASSGAKIGVLKEIHGTIKALRAIVNGVEARNIKAITELNGEIRDVKIKLHDFLQTIPRETLESWKKLQIKEEMLLKATNELAREIFGDSVSEKHTKVISMLLRSFTNYLQSSIKIVIDGISSAASGIVDIDINDSLVVKLLREIPIFGDMVSELLGEAQKYQKGIWIKEQAKHFINSAHTEIIAQEYVGYVVRHIAKSIIAGAPIGTIEAPLVEDGVLERCDEKMESSLITESFKRLTQFTDAIVEGDEIDILLEGVKDLFFDKRDDKDRISDDWEDLVSKYVELFTRYLINTKPDYSKNITGENIARGVMPAWAFEDDIGANGGWREIVRRSTVGYDEQKSALMSELSALVYENEGDIERVLKYRWGCDDYMIVGEGKHMAGDLRALVIRDEDSVIIAVRGDDNFDNISKRGADIGTRIEMIKTGIGSVGQVNREWVSLHRGFFGAAKELWVKDDGIGSLVRGEGILRLSDRREDKVKIKGGLIESGAQSSGTSSASTADAGVGGAAGAAGSGGAEIHGVSEEESIREGCEIAKSTKVVEGLKHIIITGHSMGGAIAVATYLNLINDVREGIIGKEIPNKVEKDIKDKIEIYTYGQPKVLYGRDSVRVWNSLGVKHYRIVNRDDVIVNLPMSIGEGFEHVGVVRNIGRVGKRGESEREMAIRHDEEKALGSSEDLASEIGSRGLREHGGKASDRFAKKIGSIGLEVVKYTGRMLTNPSIFGWARDLTIEKYIKAHAIDFYARRTQLIVRASDEAIIEEMSRVIKADRIIQEEPETKITTKDEDEEVADGTNLEKVLTRENIRKSKAGLDEAAKAGNIELVRWLISEHKIKPDDETLNSAAESGNLVLVQCLIGEQSLVPNYHHLLTAVVRGNLELVEFLIDVKKLNPSIDTLEIASLAGNFEIVKLLTGKYNLKTSRLILVNAVKSGDSKLVKWLIEEYKMEPNENILKIATQFGNLEIIKYLIENHQIDIKKIILKIAALYGYKIVVEYIVKLDNTILDNDILNSAAKSGNLQLVQMLIRDHDLTPDKETLDCAAWSGNLQLVQMLFNEPYSIEIDEDTIYRGIARDRDEAELVNFLVKNYNNKLDIKLLKKSASKGHLKLFELLISRIKGELDIEILKLAAKSGNFDLVKLIVDKYKIMPDKKTLDNAAKSGNLKLVEEFININKILPDKVTLLNAFKSKNSELIQKLIDDYNIAIDKDVFDNINDYHEFNIFLKCKTEFLVILKSYYEHDNTYPEIVEKLEKELFSREFVKQSEIFGHASKDLYESLRGLIPGGAVKIDELGFEDSVLMLDFSILLNFLRSISSYELPVASSILDYLKPAQEILDTELLVPLESFWDYLTCGCSSPSKRKYSVKSANKVINSESPLFARIIDLKIAIKSIREEFGSRIKEIFSSDKFISATIDAQQILRVEKKLDEFKYVNLLAGKFAHEALNLRDFTINGRKLEIYQISRAISAAEAKGSKEIKILTNEILSLINWGLQLFRIESYYEHYIENFVRVYGDSYKKTDMFRKGGAASDEFDDDGYVLEIARKVEEGELVEELNFIRVEEDTSETDLSDDIVIIIPRKKSDSKETEFVSGFLDRKTGLSLSKPLSDEKFGKHTLVNYKGVHYKYWPYAAGVEFAVSSLGQLISEITTTTPSELIVLQGRGLSNYGQEAVYLASKSISGKNLHNYLTDEKLNGYIENIKKFSSIFLSALITGSGDGKPDNYVVEGIEDTDTGELKELNLKSIDNDIAFSKAKLILKQTGETIKIYSDLVSVLFLMPQMEMKLDVEVIKNLTSRVGREVEIIAEWLSELYTKNEEYKTMIEGGILSEESANLLKLPLRLPKGTAIRLYERLSKIIKYLLINHEATGDDLLGILYPGVSYYYEFIRNIHKENLLGGIKQVYADSIDDPQFLKNLLGSNDIKSREALRTASTMRIMNPLEFREEFTDDPEKLASDFLSILDFRTLAQNDVYYRSVNEETYKFLAERLMFLEEITLKNIDVYQLDAFLDGLTIKNVKKEKIYKVLSIDYREISTYERKKGCNVKKITFVNTKDTDYDVTEVFINPHLRVSDIIRQIGIEIEEKIIKEESMPTEKTIIPREIAKACGEIGYAQSLAEETTHDILIISSTNPETYSKNFMSIIEYSSELETLLEQSSFNESSDGIRRFLASRKKVIKKIRELESVDEKCKIDLRQFLMEKRYTKIREKKENLRGGASETKEDIEFEDDRSASCRDDAIESEASVNEILKQEMSYFEQFCGMLLQRSQLSEIVLAMLNAKIIKWEDFVDGKQEFINLPKTEKLGDIESIGGGGSEASPKNILSDCYRGVLFEKKALLDRIINHHKWIDYMDLLTKIVEIKEFTEDSRGQKMCIKIYNKVKLMQEGWDILVMLINNLVKLDCYELEEKLMLFGAERGILVDYDEVKNGRYNHKKNIESGEEKTILHYLIENESEDLFNTAFAGYLDMIKYDQTKIINLFEYAAVELKNKRNTKILEIIYESLKRKSDIKLFNKDGNPKYMKDGVHELQKQAAKIKNKTGFNVGFKEMINGKIDLNVKDIYGNTVLIKSIIENQYEYASFLINNATTLKVNLVETFRFDGRNALDILQEREGEDFELTRLLRIKIAESLSLESEKLFDGDSDSEEDESGDDIEIAHESPAKTFSSDKHSKRALINLESTEQVMTIEEERLLLGDNFEAIMDFISKTPNINLVRSSDKATPLHLASYNGQDAIVELLLQRGAKLDLKNNEGKTPLDLALENGNFKVQKLIRDKKTELSGNTDEVEVLEVEFPSLADVFTPSSAGDKSKTSDVYISSFTTSAADAAILLGIGTPDYT